MHLLALLRSNQDVKSRVGLTECLYCWNRLKNVVLSTKILGNRENWKPVQQFNIKCPTSNEVVSIKYLGHALQVKEPLFVVSKQRQKRALKVVYALLNSDAVKN